MENTFGPEVIEALARLRHAASGIVGLTSPLARDIQTLDRAGVFAALDEQADSARVEGILAESARRDLEKALGYSLAPGTVPPLGLIAELKNTPVDEPLVGRQAEVYGRLLGGTSGEGKPSPYHTPHDWARTDRNMATRGHEHMFYSPHSDEICYGAERCQMTYGEFRSQKALGYTPYPSDPDLR